MKQGIFNEPQDTENPAITFVDTTKEDISNMEDATLQVLTRLKKKIFVRIHVCKKASHFCKISPIDIYVHSTSCIEVKVMLEI